MTFYLSMTIKSLLIWILIILILIAIAFVVGFCIGSDVPDEKDEKEKTIKDFAEWLQKESIFYLNYVDWKKCVRVVDEENPNYEISHTESVNATLDEVLAEYEKEQEK